MRASETRSCWCCHNRHSDSGCENHVTLYRERASASPDDPIVFYSPTEAVIPRCNRCARVHRFRVLLPALLGGICAFTVLVCLIVGLTELSLSDWGRSLRAIVVSLLVFPTLSGAIGAIVGWKTGTALTSGTADVGEVAEHPQVKALIEEDWTLAIPATEEGGPTAVIVSEQPQY